MQASELYQSGKSLAEVATAMNTSRGYVSRKLRAGGVPPQYNTRNLWTTDEDAILISNVMLMDRDLMALLPNRTEKAICIRRKALNLRKYPGKVPRKWSVEDYKFIRENTHLTDYEVSNRLGVTASSLACARLRDGIEKVYTCKVCSTELKSQGDYCQEHRHIARQMRSYTSKAMVKGREFALTPDVTYKILMARCTYCGGEGYGIDRIDSSKGYIEGNVTPCCSRCNTMKNDMVLADFESHIKRIAAHLKDKS